MEFGIYLAAAAAKDILAMTSRCDWLGMTDIAVIVRPFQSDDEIRTYA